MAELNDPVIGGRLDSSVIKQLEKRKNILVKRSNRGDEELQYLNNTSWVKLTSSVDTELLNFKGEKKYSNILAKNNILFSGTSSNDGGIRGGFNSSYSLSSTLGERPMAGIVNVQVTSQNTFGTLKVATINITVNSIEQLDDLEALFMRPGFTALLEYGHTSYPDNNSESIITTPEQIDSFFTPSSRSQIQKLINEKKKSSSNNYDAMYGVIKNFVWNMNTTGGYDCKVDLISVGEILESIQVNISPNSILSSDPFISSVNAPSRINGNYNSELKTTAIHAYLNLIKFSGTVNYYFGEYLYSNTALERATIEENLNKYMLDFNSKISENLKKAGIPKHYPTIGVNGTAVEDFGPYTKYISIAQILSLINETFLLKDNNGLLFSFFVGESGKLLTPFLTFQGHFALDPMIAVLPKPGKLSSETPTEEKTWDDLLKYNVTDKASEVPNHGQFNDILGIYLNIDYVLSCLDATIATEDATNKSLRDFINKLLNGLQNTLGDINDFDLHFDEDTSTYYVVDRKVTPDQNRLKGSKFELLGLNSIVESLTLVSKLTSNISTIMAVSAQATSSDIAQDSLSLQKWQEGLKDRHSTNKQLNPDKEIEEKIAKKTREVVKANFLDWDQVKKVVDKLNTPSKSNSLHYNSGEIRGTEGSFRHLMVKLLEFNTKKQKSSPAGLIPLELNLTVQGLGGLKIGQAFTISEELLPSRYRNNVAFLITGLDHSIRSNKWTTSIKAQMIIISKYDKEAEIDIDIINKAYKFFNNEINITETLFNWKKPLTTLTVRNDSSGLGAYGESRKFGRTHTGIDYLAQPGEFVYSPIDGTVSKGSNEFSKGHPGTTSVIIQGSGEYEGYGVILGYTDGAGFIPKEGKQIKAGNPVGTVQTLKQYYPSDPKMLNHIHFALYVGNEPEAKIDPTGIKFQ